MKKDIIIIWFLGACAVALTIFITDKFYTKGNFSIPDTPKNVTESRHVPESNTTTEEELATLRQELAKATSEIRRSLDAVNDVRSNQVILNTELDRKIRRLSELEKRLSAPKPDREVERSSVSRTPSTSDPAGDQHYGNDSASNPETHPDSSDSTREHSTDQNLVSWPNASAPIDEKKAFQRWLLGAGFNPGQIDGVLGPKTRKAFADYHASQSTSQAENSPSSGQ